MCGACVGSRLLRWVCTFQIKRCVFTGELCFLKTVCGGAATTGFQTRWAGEKLKEVLEPLTNHHKCSHSHSLLLESTFFLQTTFIVAGLNMLVCSLSRMLTSDLAPNPAHGGGVVLAAEVWRRRPEARRTEASGEGPERSTARPHGSSRNSLRTRPWAELCWSPQRQKSETELFDSRFEAFIAGLSPWFPVFGSVSFSLFGGVLRFLQRRPSLSPLVLRLRPPGFSHRHGCSRGILILGWWRRLQGKSGTVSVTC